MYSIGLTKDSLCDYLKDSGKFDELEHRLQEESHLPGPRGNLTLASDFADGFKSSEVSFEAWALLDRWIHITEVNASTGNPREFLPFCAMQAMGAHFTFADDSKKQNILVLIKEAMSDPRWRMREAAAMALQRIGERQFIVIQRLFNSMLDQSNGFERRAFMAALAHPPLLKELEHVQYALRLSEQILDDIIMNKIRYMTEEFRILSKGLEYAISLFVEREPIAGFVMLTRFAVIEDKRIRKIVKSNLSKARLAKKYSQEVNRINRLLNT